MSIIDPASLALVVTYGLPAAITASLGMVYYFGFGALMDAAKVVSRRK